MSRRGSLPGADELFRVTGGSAPASAPAAGPARAERLGPGQPGDEALVPALRAAPEPVEEGDDDGPAVAAPVLRADLTPLRPEAQVDLHEASRPTPVRPSGRRRSRVDYQPTGRERHEEKITVYCSAEELIELEHARLALRRDHGLAVDRGRIVREAIAVVLADLEAKGGASILVRRLLGR